MVSAWKSDLNRLLHVINVSGVSLLSRRLHVPFKTELIINAHTILADVRHNVSKICGDAEGHSRAVSGTRTFYHFPILADRSLDSKQVSNFDY